MKILLKASIICAAFLYTAFARINYNLPSGSVSVSNMSPYAQFNSQEYHPEPGQPRLPVKVLFFLLPPDADVMSVQSTLNIEREKVLPGEYTVIPAPLYRTHDEILLPENRVIIDGKDKEVYSRDAFFPYSYLGKAYIEQLRDYKLAKVIYYPFQYNPMTKQLKSLQKGNVIITYNNITGHPKRISYAIPYRAHALLRQIVVNYEKMIPEYKNYPVAARNESKYVILTTSAIESNAAKLNDFVSSKIKRGFGVEVVTESQWGGGTGNSGAEKIRSWLVDNYQSQQIEYALLIGKPHTDNGDVPMKMTYPKTSRDCPTDFYYGDLTGNWDKDGDGRYGEPDDVGTGGIDHIAEVGIGRIPVYNNDYATLDNILNKIIGYENADPGEIGWRKKMLLCMLGYTGNEGWEVGEALKKVVSEATNEWSYYRIYNSAQGNPEMVGVTPNNMEYAWTTQQFGLVEWLTHGSETQAMNIFSSSQTDKLDNDHPSFVFCGSCLNSHPETTNNLGYAMLVNGAIATVGGTRVTIYVTPQHEFEGEVSDQGYIYRFGKYLVLEKSHASGIVLHRIDAKNIQLSVPQTGKYAVQVYAVDGKLISTISKYMSIGKHTIKWKGHGISSRLCIVTVKGADLYLVKKYMNLIK